jgi:hypothetical protein
VADAGAISLKRVCCASLMRSVVVLLGCLGCTSVLDYGPERKLELQPLYFQDAEGTSGAGRCDREQPTFQTPSTQSMLADCDYSERPLAGKQSIALEADHYVACDPCWEEQAELWVEFLFRVEPMDGYFASPFVFLASDPAEPLHLQRETGAGITWGMNLLASDFPEPQLGVHCNRGAVIAVSALPFTTYRVEFHFDWRTSAGDMWVSEAASPRRAGKTPDVSFSCPSRYRPTGWYTRGIIKPGGASGVYYLDDIRVAATLAELHGN